MTKQILKSKKGAYNNLVTFFSILLIFVTFVIFIMLFNSGSTNAKTDYGFGSLDTEFDLKTFLYSPTSESTQNLNLKFGKEATNADLISDSCRSKDSSSSSLLSTKINEYFSKLYEDEWHVELIYYTPDSDERDNIDEFRLESFGKDVSLSRPNVISSPAYHEELKKLQDVGSRKYQYMTLFNVAVRQPGFASQNLPCLQDGTVVKIVVFDLNQNN